MLNFKKNDLKIVFEITPIYTQVEELIGNPIEYNFEKYNENPKGDNRIPEKIIIKNSDLNFNDNRN